MKIVRNMKHHLECHYTRFTSAHMDLRVLRVSASWSRLRDELSAQISSRSRPLERFTARTRTNSKPKPNPNPKRLSWKRRKLKSMTGRSLVPRELTLDATRMASACPSRESSRTRRLAARAQLAAAPRCPHNHLHYLVRTKLIRMRTTTTTSSCPWSASLSTSCISQQQNRRAYFSRPPYL